MDAIMQPLNEPKKRVCYFFDGEIGNYHYAQQHPMKPHRIKMTHSLVMNYGLYKRMEIYRAKPATRKEMAQFHTDEYVDFLSKVTPDNMDNYAKEQTKFNVGDDCPIFDGLFEYCSISAGGSMEGAARLSRDKCDIAINWAGGLHHGKKAEASGFCYINDIVLGILELLRYHQRVLYIDIDVHHGDGVEEAFYTTDRVMTCSFHKYGEFFPGTGELRDIGHGKGKHYSVNFPLRDGITDESYKSVFQPVIKQIMDMYQPGAVVLQCGSDSLSGDRLGCFNISMKGHAECVQYVKSFGLPLLLLGGGGYTIRNVSRTWAYETGLAAGVELGEKIPLNEYMEYFGPTYRLDVPCSNMEDMNTRDYLEKIKIQLFENLKHTAFAPSVQMQSVPRLDHDSGMEIDEDQLDPDSRRNQWLEDQRVHSELEHAPTIETDPPAKRQKPDDAGPAQDPKTRIILKGQVQPTTTTPFTSSAAAGPSSTAAMPVEPERATTTSDAPTALSSSADTDSVPAVAPQKTTTAASSSAEPIAAAGPAADTAPAEPIGVSSTREEEGIQDTEMGASGGDEAAAAAAAAQDPPATAQPGAADGRL